MAKPVMVMAAHAILEAGWRDPVFDAAKLYSYDWRTSFDRNREFTEILSDALNVTPEEFERWLWYSMAIEGVWGLAYHMQHQTANVGVLMGFLETGDGHEEHGNSGQISWGLTNRPGHLGSEESR